MNENQPATAQDSAAVHAWLKLLDPHERERRELLTAGVAEHTAFALYPVSFTVIAPRLTQRLIERGVEGLRGLQEDLDANLSNLRQVRDLLPADLAERYFNDSDAERSPALAELKAALRPKLNAVGLSPDNHIFIASALWYLWWLLHNREQLPEGLLETVDCTARWFGAHLLQLPELA